MSDVVHSDVVQSIRSHSEHCQTLKMECLAKRIVPEGRWAIKIFSALGRFCGIGTLQ